ncbi:hypothetical protein BJX62DRAFT_200126 [Aspergillus germanicus]
MVNTSRDVSIVTGQNFSFYGRQDSSPRTMASSFTCVTKSTSADKTDSGRIMRRRTLSHQPPERTVTILKVTITQDLEAVGHYTLSWAWTTQMPK